MKQKDDATFAELLCRVREANCTKADIALLQTCVVSEDDDNYPEDALHVYKKNVDVAVHNTKMLHKLAPDTHHNVIQAEDDIKGRTRQVAVSNIPQNSTATGGLPKTLTLTK